MYYCGTCDDVWEGENGICWNCSSGASGSGMVSSFKSFCTECNNLSQEDPFHLICTNCLTETLLTGEEAKEALELHILASRAGELEKYLDRVFQ